jgi:hypothetical protein
MYRELLIFLPFGSAARRAKGGLACGSPHEELRALADFVFA